MLKDQIKKIREEKKYSLGKLSRRSDVSITTLVKIESGDIKYPNTATLLKIANALGVKIEELLKGLN